MSPPGLFEVFVGIGLRSISGLGPPKGSWIFQGTCYRVPNQKWCHSPSDPALFWGWELLVSFMRSQKLRRKVTLPVRVIKQTIGRQDNEISSSCWSVQKLEIDVFPKRGFEAISKTVSQPDSPSQKGWAFQSWLGSSYSWPWLRARSQLCLRWSFAHPGTCHP